MSTSADHVLFAPDDVMEHQSFYPHPIVESTVSIAKNAWMLLRVKFVEGPNYAVIRVHGWPDRILHGVKPTQFNDLVNLLPCDASVIDVLIVCGFLLSDGKSGVCDGDRLESIILFRSKQATGLSMPVRCSLYPSDLPVDMTRNFKGHTCDWGYFPQPYTCDLRLLK